MKQKSITGGMRLRLCPFKATILDGHTKASNIILCVNAKLNGDVLVLLYVCRLTRAFGGALYKPKDITQPNIEAIEPWDANSVLIKLF